MSTVQTPALPWAATTPQPKAEVVADDLENASTPAPSCSTRCRAEDVGVSVGDRVQMKWKLQAETGGEATYKWWTAEVKSIEHAGTETQYHVNVTYEALDEYEPEESTICFCSDREVWDVQRKQSLVWRKEGDSWDTEGSDDEGDEEGDGEEEGAGEATVTLQQLSRDMQENEREWCDGQALQDVEDAALNSLKPSQRLAIASGYREFADSLRAFLSDKTSRAEAAGATEPVVVTAEDMAEFKKQLLAKRQRLL